MAGNVLLTRQEITFAAMFILKNNLKTVPHMWREHEKYFGVQGAKIGDTLMIRKPARFIGRDGQAYRPEGMTDGPPVPLILNGGGPGLSGADMDFTSEELKLSLDDFKRRYLEPAVISVANKIDYRSLQYMKNTISMTAGTPGTTPTDLITFLQAQAKMTEQGTPTDKQRVLFINSQMEISMVDALKGLYNRQSTIGGQLTTGRIVEQVAGFDWYSDENVNRHTYGTYTGTPLCNSATAQTGASLITDGWTSSGATLNQGDVITIAGVNAVNPQNRQSTGRLREFVVTAQISDTTGAMTIAIDPPIIAAGQFQNVDAAAADNAAITVIGASAAVGPVGIAFHPQAFAFASVPLDMPTAVEPISGIVNDKDLGLSLRFIRQYVATEDRWVNRLDVLWGIAALYPEAAACKIYG